jgi:glutathione-regulated potassium-efflux system ancillary protein KefC
MLTYTAIFLAAAILAVPLFKRLGLGAVLGYLFAGAALGPSGFHLVHEVEETLKIAELGVVLLLFLIGLELQPARLWRMRRQVFGLGGGQVVATSIVLAGVGIAAGMPWRGSLVAGVALAMSSTAFAMQVLAERNELGAVYGRSAFAILLFQDLAAIPLLAFVPLLGERVSNGAGRPALVQAAIALGLLLFLAFASRFLLRPLFRMVAQARSHELSVGAALLVVLGTGLLMELAGLSMALGAFLAGVLLADSEYRHELESNIEPFKGLLLGLFFMAVGMSANLHIVVERPGTVVAIVLGLVLVKGAVLYGLGRAAALPKSGSASLGVALSQGGEFAFVIFGVASEARVIERSTIELLIVCVTLSMVTTPLAFIVHDKLRARLVTASLRPYDDIPDEGNPVLIAGFGRFGQVVARVLRLRRIAFTALDVSAEQVDFVRRFGNRIFYGDASRVDLLRSAGAANAKLFVLAIDDMETSLRTLHVVQKHFPHLKVVARARNRQHAYALLGAGVEQVIRETFAGSLEAARITLEELGFPVSVARDTVKRFGDYDEAQVRKLFALREDEKALIESAKKYSVELQRIFEEDEQQ